MTRAEKIERARIALRDAVAHNRRVAMHRDTERDEVWCRAVELDAAIALPADPAPSTMVREGFRFGADGIIDNANEDGESDFGTTVDNIIASVDATHPRPAPSDVVAGIVAQLRAEAPGLLSGRRLLAIADRIEADPGAPVETAASAYEEPNAGPLRRLAARYERERDEAYERAAKVYYVEAAAMDSRFHARTDDGEREDAAAREVTARLLAKRASTPTTCARPHPFSTPQRRRWCDGE